MEFSYRTLGITDITETFSMQHNKKNIIFALTNYVLFSNFGFTTQLNILYCRNLIQKDNFIQILFVNSLGTQIIF